MKTQINREVLDQIRIQLETAYPNEACGFLLGIEDEQHRHITSIIEAENQSTDNQRRRFVISPLDYMKVEKQAVKDGLHLLGIYHSHPDHPAIPSIHDLEYAQPFFSYFIHSIQAGELTETLSYRLSNNHFIPEPFTVKKVISQKKLTEAKFP